MSFIKEKRLNDIEALLAPVKPQQSARVNPVNDQHNGASTSLTTIKSKPQHQRLSYLDGVRGCACVLVYILHYTGFNRSLRQLSGIEGGFGENGEYYFAALPFIRVIFTGGHLAVAIFFVISGYVLAASPLRSIHSGDKSKLLDSISSALFRRWCRLFLPVAATTFIWMTSWHVFGVRSVHGAERTYLDELWKWYADFKNYSFVFTGNHFNVYNFHVWSIALEFRGSIVVYSLLLAIQRCTTNRRLMMEAALAWYFMYVVDGWYCSLFVAGVLLCDIDMLAAQDALPAIFKHLKATPKWTFWLLLLLGLYLGGVPSANADIEWLRNQFGWRMLSYFKPQAVLDVRFYFRSIAAVLTMIAIPRISCLRHVFESGFCQYLGRISYGFYLVHGPILWSLGDRLHAASGRVAEHHIITSPTWINTMLLPSWGPLGLEVNHLAPHLILFPLTLWAAEITTRLIDEPSVKFAQFLMRVAYDEGGEGERARKFDKPR